MIVHRTIDIEGGSIHAACAGSPGNPALLFLHGWPENWKSYERLLAFAEGSHYAVAIDLPGIGASVFPKAPSVKTEIAAVVREAASALGLRNPILVGHDVGGQVAFSYLQGYPGEIAGAVILDVVIPGLGPWEEVLRNPYLWHFAFHAIPALPEKVVAGRERDYFEYFCAAIAAHPERLAAEAKEEYLRAYSRPEALSAGFEWYRAFRADAKANAALVLERRNLDVPVLYLRGEKSGGDMAQYAAGFADTGVRNLTTAVIPDSGHFIAEEQPDLLWRAIAAFAAKISDRPRPKTGPGPYGDAAGQAHLP